MKNKFSHQCCCGCDLFAFDDIFAAETGYTVIDGYRVVDKKLPAGGLWALWWAPAFSGDPSVTAQDISFRLLNDSDAVVASWTIKEWYQPDISNPALSTDGVRNVSFSINWFDVEIADTRRTYVVYPGTGSKAMVKNGIACRQACSSWVSSKYPTGDGVNNGLVLSDTLEGYRGFFLPEGNTSANDLFDTNTASKTITLSTGFPLPNRSTNLTTTGRLRVAVKATEFAEATAYTMGLFAGKIYQEPVDSSGCAGYYGSTTEEKNVDCIDPVICPVTEPHYTAPLFSVASVTGDVTFESTELSFGTSACTGIIQHAVPSVSSGITLTGSPPHIVEYRWTSWLAGTGSDYPYPFAYVSNLAGDAWLFGDTPYVWTYTGTDNADPAHYTAGSTINFRTTNFPFDVSYEILATADVCFWKVAVTFQIYSWHITGTPSTNYIGGTNYKEDGSSPGLFDPIDRVVLNNPQRMVTHPAQFGRQSIMYEKTVPAWIGTPPAIAFTSADATTTPASFKILSSVAPGLLRLSAFIDVTFEGTAVASYTDFDFANLAFSLVPRVGFKVPHP